MSASLKDYVKGGCYTSYVRFFDMTTRQVAPSDERAAPILEALRRDGFARVSGVLPLDDLPAQIARALEPGETAFSDVTRFYLKNPLRIAPGILRWLRHPLLNEVVRCYLGEDAIFDRCLVWRIPASASKRNTSALWHHDWCGRRLKIFVLLHDVEESGRPTQYVVGSHKGQWRWMNYELSRFGDEEVSGMGPVVKLTGKAGDCVFVDTNGLHRATGEGGYAARDIISLEYSNLRKSEFLAKKGFEIGIRKDFLPEGEDFSGTLLWRRAINREAGHTVYGRIPQLEKEPAV